jgi:Gram-negative bacterial TonB protein C-terminal
MIVTLHRTALVLAFVCSIPMSGGENFSKTCQAVENLVQISGCRLTECRVAAQTKVRLASDSSTGGVDAQGDLVLLDHVCQAGANTEKLVAAQVESLKEQGFIKVESTGTSALMKKASHFVELNALTLEGEPNLTVRSVTPEQHRVELASSQPVTVLAAASPHSPAPQPVEPKAATKPARATGRAPQMPAGVSGPGRVELELLIDEKGRIRQVLSMKGTPALVPIALNAVQSWTFEAAIEAGVAVPSVLIVPVEFQSR